MGACVFVAFVMSTFTAADIKVKFAHKIPMLECSDCECSSNCIPLDFPNTSNFNLCHFVAAMESRKRAVPIDEVCVLVQLIWVSMFSQMNVE